MVRGLLLLLELAVAGLALYNLAIAIAGWKNPPTSIGRTDRSNLFRIVIPAYNEERVIAGPVSDLRFQLREGDELWVLADRCTDGTADRARAAGANVAQRLDGPDGKGAALRWFLDLHPLQPGQALVVVDADNQVPAHFLSRLAEELEQGHSVLQAYLDVSNPDQSPLATASALSYWASNRMVQLARTNLGWSADLGGTGMCLTAEALAESGGFGNSLVEDQELGVRCFLAGHRVHWIHDLKVRDEKPTSATVAVKQRSRWQQGRRQVARRWFGTLLDRGTPASIDLALRLVQPSRAGIALFSAILALVSLLGAPLWEWWVWALLALIQFAAPLPFLIRERVEPRYLRQYPMTVILPLLKLVARFRRNQDWYHTPHGVNEPKPGPSAVSEADRGADPGRRRDA